MAFPVAAIPAIASLVGQAGNTYAQGKMNKKSREYNTWMFGAENAMQRQNWLLQNEHNDEVWNKQNQWNLDMWNRENEYNSPMAQMQRFKEAGLNPNLIYGQSNMGGSIATANLQSDKPGTSGSHNWTPRAPQFDLDNGVLSIAQFRESSARTDNLKIQSDVLKQDAALRAAQVANTVSQTAKTDFELGLASQLRQTSVDAAEAALRKMNVETDISLNRNEREAAMNASNIREAAQRIMLMRKEGINKDMDSKLKQLDIQLKEMGIQPHDNAAFRVLGRVLGNAEGGEFRNFWNQMKFWNKVSK